MSKHEFVLFVVEPGTDKALHRESFFCESSLELLDSLLGWDKLPQWTGVINGYKETEWHHYFYLRPLRWCNNLDGEKTVTWIDPDRLSDLDYVESKLVELWQTVTGEGAK